MNFVLERKEGLFERSYSAGKGNCGYSDNNKFLTGASVSDFIIAYTLHGSVISMMQVILLMVVVFGILEVCLYNIVPV